MGKKNHIIHSLTFQVILNLNDFILWNMKRIYKIWLSVILIKNPEAFLKNIYIFVFHNKNDNFHVCISSNTAFLRFAGRWRQSSLCRGERWSRRLFCTEVWSCFLMSTGTFGRLQIRFICPPTAHMQVKLNILRSPMGSHEEFHTVAAYICVHRVFKERCTSMTTFCELIMIVT